MTQTAAEQIALWMMDQVVAQGVLTLAATVAYIRRTYGQASDELLYVDPNGEAATRWPIAEAFRRLSANTVHWDFRQRAWIDRYPVEWMRELKN